MNFVEVSSRANFDRDSPVPARSSSTGFSLCSVDEPQLKPHRLKPVLLKTPTQRNEIQRSNLTSQNRFVIDFSDYIYKEFSDGKRSKPVWALL
jgi:hypothetical protein